MLRIGKVQANLMTKDTLVFYSIIAFAILGLTLVITNPVGLEIVYANQKFNVTPIDLGNNQFQYVGDTFTATEDYNTWKGTLEFSNPRLLDYYDYNGNPFYIDFKVREDISNIYFESETISYIIKKDLNAIETYEGGKLLTQPIQSNLHHAIKEAVNGTDTWYEILVNDSYDTTFTQNTTGIQVISKKGNFETIYDITNEGFEYTYKYLNFDLLKLDHKYGFTSICDGIDCGLISINGTSVNIGESKSKNDLKDKEIKFNNKKLDLKENTHGYTWALKHTSSNQTVIDFTDSKGRLDFNETLIVDPTVTITGTSSQGCRIGDFSPCTEKVTASSALIGFTISEICIDLHRQGTGGTGTYTLGVFDSSATTIHSFGTLDPSTVSTSKTEYCSSTGTHTLASGDYIGSSHTSGTADNSNRLKAYYLSSDTYDGTNSHRSYYTSGSFTDQTAADQQMILTYNITPAPNAVEIISSPSQTTTTVDLSFTAPDLKGESLINYLVNATTPQTSNPQTFAMNTSSTTPTITGLTLNTPYSIRVSALTAGGYNATGTILNVTTTNSIPPDAPTLAAVTNNTSSAKFTSTAGASAGDDPVKDYGLRCEINNSSGWLNTVNNSTIPVDRIYFYTGLSLNDIITCQWRDGSLSGWSPWSNNGTAIIIITAAIEGNTPLNDLNDWLVSNGGIYFGMGLFGLAFILIAVMATPKTIPLFTVILLIFAGILQATSILILPIWFWGMAIVLAIPLVFKRKN